MNKDIQAYYESLLRRFKVKDLKMIFYFFLSLFVFSLFKLGHDWYQHHRYKLPGPMLIREGPRIIIPADSHLRQKITLAPVRKGQVERSIDLYGTIKALPNHRLKIYSPLQGKIVRYAVAPGQKLEKGQLLMKIASPEMANTYADYRTAKSQRQLSKKALARSMRVNQAGANAKKDIEIALNNYNAAVYKEKSLQERLSILSQSKHQFLKIYAPSAGIVNRIFKPLGTYIIDTEKPLLEMVDTKAVLIEAFVPEHLSAMPELNQSVRLGFAAFPGLNIQAKIDYIKPVMDKHARVSILGIYWSNPPLNVKLNMFATVSLFLKYPEHIMLPNSAIVMDNDASSVFLEVAPWVFEKRTIILGHEADDSIEVLHGLKEGDKIISAGGILIND